MIALDNVNLHTSDAFSALCIYLQSSRSGSGLLTMLLSSAVHVMAENALTAVGSRWLDGIFRREKAMFGGLSLQSTTPTNRKKKRELKQNSLSKLTLDQSKQWKCSLLNTPEKLSRERMFEFLFVCKDRCAALWPAKSTYPLAPRLQISGGWFFCPSRAHTDCAGRTFSFRVFDFAFVRCRKCEHLAQIENTNSTNADEYTHPAKIYKYDFVC